MQAQVVAAIAKQLATLNTNVRYLHRGVVDFAEEIAKLLPPELCVRPLPALMSARAFVSQIYRLMLTASAHLEQLALSIA